MSRRLVNGLWRKVKAAGEANLSADLSSSVAPTQPAPSRWGAFGSVTFTVIWTASVTSNVGTAMFDTASGWLITSLDANPMIVSLVQVACHCSCSHCRLAP